MTPTGIEPAMIVVVVVVLVKRGSLGIIWPEMSQKKKTENGIPQTTAGTHLNRKCFTNFVCVSRLFVVAATPRTDIVRSRRAEDVFLAAMPV